MMRAMIKAALACAVLAFGCKKSSDAPPPPAPAPVPAPAPKAAEPIKPRPPEGPDPKLVERGAYLANAAGCGVCHTALGPNGPDLDHAYAGGFEMADTIGTWRSPNITPDKNSGIGNWTDDQIAAAIREGVRPDGGKLFAVMPYMSYNRMTDADVKALVAFLRTVKPVDRVVAPNKDLKLVPIDAPRPANAQVDQGEYMASIMLCSHCHFTPGKNMQPAAPDKMFSGGQQLKLPMLGTGILYAANITSDPDTGIGKWSEDHVYDAIKMMTKPDGKLIEGPMRLLQASWSQLDDKDLHAVAAYIKKLPPVKNKVAASTFKPNAH